MYTKEDLTRIISKCIDAVQKTGVTIDSAYLFGSYANGTAGDYSDIDLALVSKQFKGIRSIDMERIRKQVIGFVDIEIHPFNLDDFNTGNPLDREIIETGIKITG